VNGKVEITVVDPSAYHVYQPAWLLIPFRIMHQNEAIRPERSLLAETVKFRQEKAKRIDLNNRVVETDSAKLQYDFLVISTGARPDYSQVPGLDKPDMISTLLITRLSSEKLWEGSLEAS